MSMLDIKALMHSRIEDLFASIGGNSSDVDCQAALRTLQMAHYSDLASLAWFLGCDASTFQREAVPAAEIVDEAYYEVNLSREFEAATHRQPYSTMNHRQQGIAR
jgi:hypothetical protein